MGSNSDFGIGIVHWQSTLDGRKRLLIPTQLPNQFCHKQQRVDKSQLTGPFRDFT
jgi:hypothetical protein